MNTEQSIPFQEWCFGSGKWHEHWEMLTCGCELHQDTKMLLEDWVRLGLNNRCTEYRCSTTQRNTDTQGAKSVSQFQTVIHRWSRCRSALQSTVTGAVQNSHLSKGLALLTTEGWAIISAVLWFLQFSVKSTCSKLALWLLFYPERLSARYQPVFESQDKWREQISYYW